MGLAFALGREEALIEKVERMGGARRWRLLVRGGMSWTSLEGMVIEDWIA